MPFKAKISIFFRGLAHSSDPSQMDRSPLLQPSLLDPLFRSQNYSQVNAYVCQIGDTCYFVLVANVSSAATVPVEPGFLHNNKITRWR